MKIFIIIVLLFLTNIEKINAADYTLGKKSFHIGFLTSSENSNIILNPILGYFIFNNLEIGAIYKNNMDWPLSSYGNKITGYFGLGFRTVYYIGRKSNKIFPYLGISYILEKANIIEYYYPLKSEYSSEQIVPHIGFCFMLSSKISAGIELQKSQKYSRFDYDKYYSIPADKFSEDKYYIAFQFSGYFF